MNQFLLPSHLELQVLSVLWYSGPSTVAAVCESMPDGKERAYTTILTVLQNLEKKGHIHKEQSARAYVYEAAHPKNVVLAEVIEEFVLNAFGGRLSDAILALLATGVLTAEEKASIQALLNTTKTRAAKQPKGKVDTTKKSNADVEKKPLSAKKNAKARLKK
jgi:predicted transcriptional regulator